MPNQGVTINVSSYTRGGILEEVTAHKISEVLTQLNVIPAEATLDLTDVEGDERKATVSTVLREGDVLAIMRKKNQSGS